jgi:AcrR family transcriptional regulator
MAKAIQTKRSLVAAFRKLIAADSYDRITVSAIASTCGVNRQMFYYHFRDIYDLTAWMVEDETNVIMKSFGDDWERAYIRLLELLRADRVVIIRMIRSVDMLSIYRLLKKQSQSLMSLAIKQLSMRSELPTHDLGLLLEFYAAGLTEVAIRRLEEGRKESPEELLQGVRTVMRVAM